MVGPLTRKAMSIRRSDKSHKETVLCTIEHTQRPLGERASGNRGSNAKDSLILDSAGAKDSIVIDSAVIDYNASNLTQDAKIKGSTIPVSQRDETGEYVFAKKSDRTKDLFDNVAAASSDVEIASPNSKFKPKSGNFLRNSVRKNAKQGKDIDTKLKKPDSHTPVVPVQKPSKEEVLVAKLTEANLDIFNKMQKGKEGYMEVYFTVTN